MSRTPTTAEIEKNLGLVHMIVNRNIRLCSERLADKDDLIAWGTLGLIHSLRFFDPEYGTKLSTYAGKCILGYIYQGLRSLRKEIWYGRDKGMKFVSIPLDDVHEPLIDQSYNEDKIIHLLDNHMTVHRLVHGINVLSDRQRYIVDLMMENNGDQSKVAKIVGCTRQNVSYVWKYSMKKLREHVEENGDGCTKG